VPAVTRNYYPPYHPPCASFPPAASWADEETVEKLYLLGEQDRIVGVSRLCGSAAAGSAREAAGNRHYLRRIPKIMTLEQDLVLLSRIAGDIVPDLGPRRRRTSKSSTSATSRYLAMIRTLGDTESMRPRAQPKPRKATSSVLRNCCEPGPRQDKIYSRNGTTMIRGLGWVSDTDRRPPVATSAAEAALFRRREGSVIYGCRARREPDVILA